MTDEATATGDVSDVPTPQSTNDVLPAAPEMLAQQADALSSSAGDLAAVVETEHVDAEASAGQSAVIDDGASTESAQVAIDDTGVLAHIAAMLAEHSKAIGEQLAEFVERDIAPIKHALAELRDRIESNVAVTVSGPSDIADLIEKRVTKIEARIRHIV